MNKELSIVFSFFKRDLYVYKSHALGFFINSSLIIPFLFTLSHGIVLPTISSGQSNPWLSTLMILGSALWVFYQVPGKMNVELLFDMDDPQFIVYQMSVLPPWLVLLEKTLFTSLITFLHMLPFFIVSKLLMGSLFLTSSTSWSQVMIITYLSGLLVSTIMLFMVCFIEGRLKLRNFMVRVIMPLIQLGGFFGSSWQVIKTFSPTLGMLILLNPFIYISEGLRFAVLQDKQFIPFAYCVSALIAYSILFFYLSVIYFKKKMDHI